MLRPGIQCPSERTRKSKKQKDLHIEIHVYAPHFPLHPCANPVHDRLGTFELFLADDPVRFKVRDAEAGSADISGLVLKKVKGGRRAPSMAVLYSPAAGGMVGLTRLAVPCFPWTFAKGSKARREGMRKAKGRDGWDTNVFGLVSPTFAKKVSQQSENRCEHVGIYTLNESSHE